MLLATSTPEVLHPTLWRTCRVLANKTRLRILRELCLCPEQRVSDIGRRLGLSSSLASQSLRALNARGLLAARRVGPLVCYSLCANRSIPNSVRLLKAIQKTFAADKNPYENIFKYSTAFTHPRRILIIKALSKRPVQLEEIAFKTNIPFSALARHLRKLAARGFLKHDACGYICSVPRHRFARLLLYLVRCA